MTAVVFILIGVVGLMAGVVVIRCAVEEQAQMARGVRADLAEIEAARDAQEVAVVNDLPRPPAPLLTGEVLSDSHEPDWAPITPDLIA